MKLIDLMENEPLGKCFENSYKYITSNPADDLVLVHGWVRGTAGSAAGKRYEHAWVERIDSELPQGAENLSNDQQEVLRRTAIDITTDERLQDPMEVPAVVYRGIGNAEVVKEYTRMEAIKEALKHKHYGPWAF